MKVLSAPVPGGLAGVSVDSGLDGLVELVLKLDQTSPGNGRRYKTFFLLRRQRRDEIRWSVWPRPIF